VVASSGEICFFPLETKKTTFFAEIFKIQGSQGPLSPLRRPCIQSFKISAMLNASDSISKKVQSQ